MDLLRRHRWGVLAVGLAFAVYAPTLRYGFVFDDTMLIGGNANLTWAHVGRLLTSPFWATLEGGRLSPGLRHLGGMYRPVVSFANLVDRSLGGGAAWPFHLTNVLGQAASVGLAYLLFLGFVATPWQAGALALLWGVHPAQTEVVAWTSGRTDLFASLFLLAAFVLYARGRSAALFGLMVGLAAGSKEGAVFLVPMLAVFCVAGLMPWRPRYFAVALGVLAAYFALRAWALAGVPPPTGSLWEAALKVPELTLQHLAAVAIPWGARGIAPKAVHDVTLLTLELGASAALVYSALRHRTVAAGLAWFLLFFVPTAVGAGRVYAGLFDLISMRFVSFAMIGLLLALADWLFGKPRSRRQSSFVAAGLACYTLAGAAQTAVGDEVYRDSHSFWATRAAESPDSDMVHYNFGLQLMSEGDFSGCAEQMRRSVAVNPRYFLGNGFLYLAACDRALARPGAALTAIDEGLRWWPGSEALLASKRQLEGSPARPH